MALTKEEAAILMAKLEASVGPAGVSSGLPQGFAGYPSPDAISTMMVGGTENPILRAFRWASVQATYEGGGGKPVLTGQFRTLEQGERSPEAAELNKALAASGFYDGEANDVYDAKTDAALAAFTQAKGLKYDGDVKHTLWQAVSSASSSRGYYTHREDRILAEGMSDVPSDPAHNQELRGIRDFQAYVGLEQTGQFGAAEKEATNKWQKEHGLPVTGQVDHQTMVAMNEDIVTRYDARIKERANEILDCMKLEHGAADHSEGFTPVAFAGDVTVPSKGCKAK